MGKKPADIKSIFFEALRKKNATERAAYLDSACSKDASLRAEVESLLQSYEKAGDFLPSPDLDPDVTLDSSPLEEGPGTVIGNYKLLEQIGEGGMAVVYMAEQEKPLRRRVALKIIKLGMDTKQVIARFEVERQALAMMDHPNISKVLDAGTTETGRPYFVMELVKGVSITDYCDKNKLSTKERLDLFISVCNAVQHAHQKGIIHRDIKPSNVMVTLHDGKPVPKVIDFGIAKATSQRLTEKTVFTRYAQMIGTPAYMSPEQAEMSGLDVDTRTDIYSLGVLLYELLTSATPFSEEHLREAGYLEIQRIIREEEPVKPSTKLSTLGDTLTDVAEHRRASPDLLRKLVRGDLDWIVMKSLEKDRTRRYDTATELAADIERHFNSEPVLAAAPSVLYRLHKFVRRNRALVTGIAAVVAVLMVGFVVSTAMYLRVQQALDAVAELEKTVETDRSLSTAQRYYAEGRYRAALDEVEARLQHTDSEPRARLLYAHLLFEVGRFGDAEAELEKLLNEAPEISGAAHCLLTNIYSGVNSAKAKEHRQFAESLLPQTAEAYSLRGMTAITPERTIEWLSKAVELDPSYFRAREARALAYYTIKDYQKMEQDAEAIIAIKPKDSLGYSIRAIARRETGQLNEAIKDLTHAIEICDLERELADLHNERRETYVRTGEHREALKDAQRCIELEPEEFVYRFYVFTSLVSLGEYEAAIEEYKKIVGADPTQQEQYEAWARKHVFNILGAGGQFDVPEDFALNLPFSAMKDAAEYYRTLSMKATRLVTAAYGQSSWSPDGKQLAYGRSDLYTWRAGKLKTGAPAISEPSGIEVVDVETGKARMLVTYGKDPVWSPDGVHIAFTRGPQVRVGDSDPTQDEIWIVRTEEGEPRRLANGCAPMWTNDSRRVFFLSRDDSMLYSIRIDEPGAEPKPVISCKARFPKLSPDGQYLAYTWGSELRIKEVTSGSIVTRWRLPRPHYRMFVRWLPNGRELSLAGYLRYGSSIWIFDLDHLKGWHIFDGPAQCPSWSPEGSRMSIWLNQPFEEIWVTELDPTIPAHQSLEFALSYEEYLIRKQERYTSDIERDPVNKDRHFRNLSSVASEQYRIDEYEDAVLTLLGIDRLSRATNIKLRPRNIAHLAMALHQLERDKEAKAALNRLRRMFKGKHAQEEKYLYEVEKLFTGENSKLYPVWDCIKAGKLEEASLLVEELQSLPRLKDTEIAGGIQSVIKALARAYYNRGRSAKHHGGGYGEAIADYQASARIDPNFASVFCHLAWLRATCPDTKLRNGTEAIDKATRACELTNWEDHHYIGAFAAIHAELGDFDAAIKWQQKALDLLTASEQSEWRHDYESRLKLYQSGRCYDKGNLWAFSRGRMIGWWKFNEVKNGKVMDSSGNDLDGKLIGGAIIVSDVERGSVLKLDGNGDYMQCAHESAFDITDEITIACWLNVNSVKKEWQAIVTKGDSAWGLSTSYDLRKFNFAVTGPLSAYGRAWIDEINGGSEIAAGEWHHVCGTYDGSHLRLYVDSVEDPASPIARSYGITTNDSPVLIGENEQKKGRYWDGLIDDVRIYSYALSEQEVKELYASSKEHNLSVSEKNQRTDRMKKKQ